MSEPIPKAVWQGSFSIGGVDLHCSVLDTGQRVIDVEDIENLFSAMETDKFKIDKFELEAFAKWQRGL